MARRRKSSAAEDLMDLMPCYSSFRAVGFTGFSPRPRAARYFFASSQGTELPVASNLAQRFSAMRCSSSSASTCSTARATASTMKAWEVLPARSAAAEMRSSRSSSRRMGVVGMVKPCTYIAARLCGKPCLALFSVSSAWRGRTRGLSTRSSDPRSLPEVRTFTRRTRAPGRGPARSRTAATAHARRRAARSHAPTARGNPAARAATGSRQVRR